MVGSPFPLRNSGLGRKIEKKVYRPITQKGKKLFHHFLGGLSWDSIDRLNLNVNSKFEIFMNTLHNAYLECFHEKTYSKRTDQSQNMGWFNDDLKKNAGTYTLSRRIKKSIQFKCF